MVIPIPKLLQRDNGNRKPILPDLSSASEKTNEYGRRHHSFFMWNKDDGGEDSGDGDGTPETKTKKNAHHAKDEDPNLLWRDFGTDKTNSMQTTGTVEHHAYDSSAGNENSNGSNLQEKEDKENGCNEEKGKSSPCPSDEMENATLPSEKKDDAASLSTSMLLPSASSSWCSSSATHAAAEAGTSNHDKDSSISVSLEEGWKGVMVASFGAPALPSGTSTAASREDALENEIESVTTEERSNTSKSYYFPAPPPSAASSTSGGNLRSFSSVNAWLPVLSSDDDDENENSNNNNNHDTNDNETPVYAALVLDSMLGPDDETEKPKEDDSLLWTWVGRDNSDHTNSPPPPPPIEKIAFDVTWDDDEAGKETLFHGKEDGDFLPPPLDEEDIELPPNWEDSNSNSSSNKNNNHDDDETKDGKSLSLMAASTYSRVFGLDYLENHEDVISDEEDMDWSIERATRREVPYGNGSSGDWRHNHNSNNHHHHGDGENENSSVSADSSTDLYGSATDASRTTSDEEYSQKCLWITIAVVIGGLALVFGLVFVVFYYAIEATKTAGRR